MRLFANKQRPSEHELLFNVRAAYVRARRAGISRIGLEDELLQAELSFRFMDGLDRLPGNA